VEAIQAILCSRDSPYSGPYTAATVKLISEFIQLSKEGRTRGFWSSSLRAAHSRFVQPSEEAITGRTRQPEGGHTGWRKLG
jgi:hypothetical protein